MVIDAHVDALIFDMDGTLWDATASYAEIWNRCFYESGMTRRVDSDELMKYMGQPIASIVKGITGNCLDDEKMKSFIDRLGILEDEMMPMLGGKPFAGLNEGLAKLSKYYRLFMLSNCGIDGLPNFMRYTGTEDYFSGYVSYGDRPMPKGDNMKYLMAKYGLGSAVYVGDTQGDCDETHRAGIPFVYAKYGFGDCRDYDMSFDSFTAIVDYFINLKKD